ncbi:peptidylprolyl isomerase, partial [candidate division KSB1 bacterium]|nr:peptidylprolyl isomerase [candidate division KSB1 bacterium]
MWKFVCICLIISLLFLVHCGQKSANTYLFLVNGKHGMSQAIFMRNFQLNKDIRNQQSFKIEDVKDYIENDILPNFLLLAEGYALGIDQDSSLQTRLASQERRLLIRANGPLVHFIQPDPVSIDSIELIKYYHQQSEQFKIAHILVKSRSLADSLYRLTQQGVDFGALAAKFSSDLQTAERGGEFFQEYISGTLGQAFDSACVILTPGQIAPPVRTHLGYHLIKLLERYKRTQNTFLEEKRHLESQIKRLKQINLLDTYHQTLYEKYNLIIHDLPVLLLPQIYQMDDASQLPRLDIKRLNETQLNMVIAQYDGGALTVTQVIEEYFRSGRSSRIPLRRQDEVEDFIRMIVLDDLKLLDAKKLKLDQSIEFKNEIEIEKQQLIIKQTRQRLINQKIQIE